MFVKVTELIIDGFKCHASDATSMDEASAFTLLWFGRSIKFTHGELKREYAEGTVVLLSPSDMLCLYEREVELANTVLKIAGPGAAEAVAAYNIPLTVPIGVGFRPAVHSRFLKIKKELGGKALYWEDAVSDLVLGLLREVANAIVARTAAASSQQLSLASSLEKIRRAVHSDLASRWTLQEMAALGGMKPCYFSVMYKDYYGVSPVHDLLCTRLKHAEHLLENRPMTVAHIAHVCGFKHTEHFTRLFRKRTGSSPRQKRNRIRIYPPNNNYETIET